MKRAKTMLGALALMAAGFLFAAPAHAVTCADVPGGSGSWPYAGFTHFCSNTTQSDGTKMAGTLNNILQADQPQGNPTYKSGYILSNYPTLLTPTAGSQFWLFKNHADFNSYCSANPGKFGYSSSSGCPALQPSWVGVTYATQGYALVFVDGRSSGMSIEHVTAHEAGHLADTSWQWRTLLSTGGYYSSGSTAFQSELNKDWDNLNNTSNYMPCSIPGLVFTGQKSESLVWICSNNGSGPTLNSPDFSGSNENVLKKAWGYFYNPHKYSKQAVLGGTATANDVITITVTDASLPSGSRNVTYTVPSNGTTTTQMATGIALAINTDTVLSTAVISATASGGQVTIISRTRTPTSYSYSVSGAHTESIIFVGNDEFTNGELVAEEFAYIYGKKFTGSPSPDYYFGNSKFYCTRTLVESMAKYGQVPGQTGSVKGWPAGQNCPAIP